MDLLTYLLTETLPMCFLIGVSLYVVLSVAKDVILSQLVREREHCGRTGHPQRSRRSGSATRKVRR